MQIQLTSPIQATFIWLIGPFFLRFGYTLNQILKKGKKNKRPRNSTGVRLFFYQTRMEAYPNLGRQG